MQTIWKGAISFGLVSIPVRVYSATDERGVQLRQVHSSDGGRIRYRRFCEIDGEEVPYSDIAKGYELPDGDMIVLTDGDLDKLPLPSTKAVDVLQFVPAQEIDSIQTARSYYLKADGSGAKPYVLFREALESTGKVAIVKVALRSRESLATLRPYQGVLLLQLMLWPEEIRDASQFVPDDNVTVRPQEVAMAESYIDTLSGDFDPSEYTDEYKAALEAVVEAKAAGREIKERPQEPTTEVVDLMEALRQSVARAKEQREGPPEESGEAAATGTAAKKTPTKTAATKRAATKDQAAKDQAAKDEAEAAAKTPAEKKGTTAKSAPGKAAVKSAAKKTAAKRTQTAEKTPASKTAAAKSTSAKKAASSGRTRRSA